MGEGRRTTIVELLTILTLKRMNWINKRDCDKEINLSNAIGMADGVFLKVRISFDTLDSLKREARNSNMTVSELVNCILETRCEGIH